MPRHLLTRSALLLSLLAPALGAQVLLPGANSRGYVSRNQVFGGGLNCATSGFAGTTFALAFDAGNKIAGTAEGCVTTGWTGETVMDASARLIHSFTSVAVTDPSLVQTPSAGPFGIHLDVIGLSRSVWRDGFTVSSSGASVNMVRFYVDLFGAGNVSAPGSGSFSRPTRDVGMRFSPGQGAPFTQNNFEANGTYVFSQGFSMNSFMATELSLQSFATLAALSLPGGGFDVLDGSALTDGYARIREVQFLYCDVTCDDRTSAADVSWQSGADYRTVYDAVPEPASLALVATGLLGIGLVARQRRRLQAG